MTDVPCVLFREKLLNAYLDAKVVLVDRDEDKFVPSCEVLLEGVLNPVARYVLQLTDPLRFGWISICGAASIERLSGTKTLAQAKKNARAAYREHYAIIRKPVLKERMLEYKLGSGWEPLRKFLGKAVPDVPFPKRNQAATLQSAFGDLLRRASNNSRFNLALVVAAGASVWRGSLAIRILDITF